MLCDALLLSLLHDHAGNVNVQEICTISLEQLECLTNVSIESELLLSFVLRNAIGNTNVNGFPCVTLDNLVAGALSRVLLQEDVFVLQLIDLLS